MNLALTLFRKSAAQSKGRLALITFAISLCVAMILSFSAFVAGLTDMRAVSLTTAMFHSPTIEGIAGGAITPDEQNTSVANPENLAEQTQQQQILAKIPENSVIATIGTSNSVQKVGIHSVKILELQTTSDNPPDLYGIEYPQPGEFYASHALATELSAHPEWSIRFGTKYLGELPQEFTSGPDDYLAVIGNAQLTENPTAYVVSSWNVADEDFSLSVLIIRAVLYLGLTIILFPVALLISVAAKLGSVQREQRYAALRLVGATNRQVFWIVTIEALIASVLGYIIGIGLYFAVHPLLSQIRFGSSRMWPSMISVGIWHYLGTAIFTFALVYFANGWSLRRLSTSPLGLARRQEMEKKPSFFRILPLIAGMGIFIWVWLTTKENDGNVNTIWFILGAVVLCMFGLTISGTWITAMVAKVFAKFARKPTSFIGWQYVRSHASRISRSVAGVVLALFAGSFFLTAVSDVDLESINEFQPSQSVFADGTVIIAPHSGPEAAAIMPDGSDLTSHTNSEFTAAKYGVIARSIPGIKDVQTISSYAWWPIIPCTGGYLKDDCANIFKQPTDASGFVAVNYGAPYDIGTQVVYGADRTEIGKKIGADAAMDQDARTFIIMKIDSLQTLENLRTEIVQQQMDQGDLEIYVSSKYSDDFSVINSSVIVTLTKITYAGIIATILIATLSLVVSTYASILERRRTLLTLRLTGMTLGEINRMILVESLAPLLLISVISTAIGIGAGWIFMQVVSATLSAQISPVFAAVLAGSMLAAALAIRAVLPSIRKVTELSANRQE
ncbi:ABC transporter permease [Arcanobacterium hippocoleae]|uniref:ABC-type antimicrobial peptide transport system permease subunit n=1 Tax=Arcanobacterium hippocoleae TaxID=149017 RepID=A0ABU1SZT9_9ACTO|nr:ABC transporter permease [Arcanobacterium hippocoleae]MDR6938585.1 ABC-type antimicrobial peptide transport system permease subunit [Arcanobacterium hippocoleae]